jgi:type I restriction enzyme S subunit
MISSLYVCFKAKKELIDAKLLLHILKSPQMIYKYGVNGEGGVRIYLFYPNFSRIKVKIPGLEEQGRIAFFLDLIEKRIEIQSKIIERYESLIKAILQHCQSAPTSKKIYLKDILTERKELNGNCYDICSVSVSKGVINQVEYLGRSFAAKDTARYHVVHKGDIVYTKSPTGEFPYGIVKQSLIEMPVAVSPLYGVYKPISLETGIYLHHYFCNPKNTNNYLHKLIQKGAKNTINITNQHFLDNIIPLPDENTLKIHVAFIERLVSLVEIEKRQLSLTCCLKSYLLSNMFK